MQISYTPATLAKTRAKMSGAQTKFTLINIPELGPANAYFVELDRYSKSPWVRLSGMPANVLERRVTRPHLSRYRGALQAMIAAKRVPDPIIISHLPVMTAAVSRLAGMFRVRAPHIGFSFNFTNLPVGSDFQRLAPHIARVDRLIVYSHYEARIYAEYFDIPLDRFRVVRWTQDPPFVAETGQRPFKGPYLCAIGAEGRDYGTLLNAARASGLPLAIIARPHSLVGLDLPENVRSFSNLPFEVTWEIASTSVGVIVPLFDLTTRCGVLTIVSAAQLGLPAVTNRTHTLAEYLDGHVAGPVYVPGEVDDCARAMRDVFDNALSYRQEARSYVDGNRAFFDRAIWGRLLDSVLDEFA